jgi:hypothetical protein
MAWNIFDNNAFSNISLTTLVNKVAGRTGWMMQNNIFRFEGVRTTQVAVEEQNGELGLVQTSKRGGPAPINTTLKGKVRSFIVPHVKIDDQINVEEVQDLREAGSTDQLRSIERVVEQRLAQMSGKVMQTLEAHMLGALRGTIFDADGSVLLDLRSAYGLPPLVTSSLGLANPNPPPGLIRKQFAEIRREIAKALGNNASFGVTAFFGDAVWDAFITHPEVERTWLYSAAAADLRNQIDYQEINYAGVRVVNLPAWLPNGMSLVDDNEAIFFPTGTGQFVVYNAPANTAEFVNTLGLPLYALRGQPTTFGDGLPVRVESNPLCLNIRPETIVLRTI